MAPLTGEGLALLYRRMRQYRIFFWAYVASALFYAASVAALSRASRPSPYPLGDVALVGGLVAVGILFLGRWALFRPSAFRASSGVDFRKAVDHVFFSLLLLLALGEALGMGALTAATFGAAPAWKPLLLCTWQLLLSTVLTPDRSHWDRLLTLWDDSSIQGGTE